MRPLPRMTCVSGTEGAGEGTMRDVCPMQGGTTGRISRILGGGRGRGD